MAKFYRVKQIAEHIGLKERTIRAYVLEQKIPYIKVNGCVLFDIEEIEKWLRSKQVLPVAG